MVIMICVDHTCSAYFQCYNYIGNDILYCPLLIYRTQISLYTALSLSASPVINAPIQGTLFYVNETNITIECHSQGFPAPAISVYTDSEPMQMIMGTTTSVLQPSGVYEVRYTFIVTPTENQTLICRAENMIPEVNASTPTFSDAVSFHLIVQSNKNVIEWCVLRVKEYFSLFHSCSHHHSTSC